MSLSQFCTASNWVWDGTLGSAFHYERDDGQMRTVFRYDIPFPPDKEPFQLKLRKVSQSGRLAFYQHYVRCIQRQVTVSKYLSQANVNSILTYSKVEQERTEQGTTCIYLETEQVWPILQKLLVGEVPSLTILDVISRLAFILRDTAKEPVGVIHRGLDLNEVYISAENKILLGGFFYASCPKLGAYPDFLPGGPSNIPPSVQQGNAGSHKTDVQTLSAIAWNLFSGLPHNSVSDPYRRVSPEFSTPELTNALLLGQAGEDDICNAFRRKLSDCRKMLNKPDSPKVSVPIRSQRLKEFQVELV